MAISIGATITNMTQTNASSALKYHTCDAGTNTLVVIIKGYESSDGSTWPYFLEGIPGVPTAPVVVAVEYPSTSGGAFVQAGYYRNAADGDDAFVSIWYQDNPRIGLTSTYLSVRMSGTCTDLCWDAINLISSTGSPIKYDNQNFGTDADTVHALTISPARTGSLGVAGIVNLDALTSDIAPTSTPSTGTLVTGSEVDFGSQASESAWLAESGGSVSFSWTKVATNDSWALACTFYEQISPTLLLTDPTGGETVADSTPTLTFTGTDTDSDEIDYHVEIDTATGFNSSTGDVGSEATDRVSTSSGRITWISTLNPADKDGVIDSIELWAATNLTYCKVGTFFGSGTSWEMRDYATIGDVTAGSKQTFSNLNILVQTGDLLGIGYETGTLETTTNSGGDLLYKYFAYTSEHLSYRDYFIPGVRTYDTLSTRTLSLYGHINSPLISEPSPADDHANWSGTGDPHPWPSGNAITFTVPAGSALSDDTYYWRVRGVDPSGYATYYFDGSDAAASDPGGVWTNETNADDGDVSTTATTTTTGTESSNYIQIEGTNAASSGLPISRVDLRISWGSLGNHSNYISLMVPSGGWTWAKVQALETRIWYLKGERTQAAIYLDGTAGGAELGMVQSGGSATGTISAVELKVYYGGSNIYGAWGTGAGSGYESFVVSTGGGVAVKDIIQEGIITFAR